MIQSQDSSLNAPLPPSSVCRTRTFLHWPLGPDLYRHPTRKSISRIPVRSGPHSNAVSPLLHEDGCLDCFHSIAPLGGGLTQFGVARLVSAVLQLQGGDPLVAAAALLAEAADALQGRTLQRLHRGVLQHTEPMVIHSLLIVI